MQRVFDGGGGGGTAVDQYIVKPFKIGGGSGNSAAAAPESPKSD